MSNSTTLNPSAASSVVTPVTNVAEPSQFAQQLEQLSQFICLRQQQKQQLTKSNKNSLSKNNQNLIKNTKEKNNEFDYSQQALFKLIRLLGEQLNDGHTIYTLKQTNERQKNLLNLWQQQSWITDITHANLAIDQVNTPIVMQSFDSQNNPFTNGVGQSLSPQYIEQNAKTTIFWLQRQWAAEKQLATQLMNIANRTVQQLDMPINESKQTPNSEQQAAIEKASQFALSIITGGPGTGKTFTVAQLVTRLQQAYANYHQQNPDTPPLSIALTAPTGKAAQRMQESLAKSLEGEKINLDNAKTLHRLLGIGQDGIPKYHANNPLPDDLVIVDEASMLGLELASLLVDAIKPTGRLILLGDANQLSAVDAGSVLADLCEVPALQPYRTELVESKRFNKDSAIGKLAMAIGQSIQIIGEQQKLRSIYRLLQEKPLTGQTTNHQAKNNRVSSHTASLPNSNQNSFYKIEPTTNFNQVYQQLAKPYQTFFELVKQWNETPQNIHDAAIRQQLFACFDSYRILTAGHLGQLGSQLLNQKMKYAFYHQTQLGRSNGFFYHGQPIMIKHNDYQLGLFNGDIGICLQSDGAIWACFADKVIPTSRLNVESCELAYAMTIHKSQGSEFGHVAVCLDRAHIRLLSQELIYTAVTRSKGELSLFSQINILRQAVLQKGNRQTGLALQFDN